MKIAFNLFIASVFAKKLYKQPEYDETITKLSPQVQQEFLTYAAVPHSDQNFGIEEFNKIVALYKEKSLFVKSDENTEYDLGHYKLTDLTEEEQRAFMRLSSQ